MASFLFLAQSLLFILEGLLYVEAKTNPVSPGPSASPLNLAAILEKGGQYATFLRLLQETRVGEQIQSQLNDSYNGLTLFVPTDNAFAALKAGMLNGLDNQEHVSLVLYHVLPRYYSPSIFATASNPVKTQASGNQGVYTLNVTGTSKQLNVSTGIDEAVIDNKLYSEFPLAVYSVDKVLLPYQLFGTKPPAAAPVVVTRKRPEEPEDVAAATPAEADVKPSAASFGNMKVEWGVLMGLLCCVWEMLLMGKDG